VFIRLNRLQQAGRAV